MADQPGVRPAGEFSRPHDGRDVLLLLSGRVGVTAREGGTEVGDVFAHGTFLDGPNDLGDLGQHDLGRRHVADDTHLDVFEDGIHGSGSQFGVVVAGGLTAVAAAVAVVDQRDQ